MKRTWFAAAAVVGTAALVLSGCSAPAPEPVEDNVTLRIAGTTSDPAILEVLQGIVDAFAEADPEVSAVKIEPTVQGQNTKTVITTQIGAGDAPDVGWIGDTDSAYWVDGAGLVDLTSTLNSTEGYDFADINYDAMQSWVRDDSIFGVPFSTSPAVLFYNSDLFTAAGLETPDEMLANGDWTWESLSAAGAAIKQSQGIEGYVIGPYAADAANWAFLSQIWTSYGATPWSADGLTCEFDSSEMVDALTQYHDMVYKDGSYPAPGTLVDFASGSVAMQSTFVSASRGLADVPFGWGIVPLPSGPEGQKPLIGQSAFVAFAAAKHADASSRLIAWLTTADSETQLSKWFVPIRTSVLTPDLLIESFPTLNAEQIQTSLIDMVPLATTGPTHPNFAAIQPAVKATLDSFYQPDANVEEIAAALCSSIDPLLAG